MKELLLFSKFVIISGHVHDELHELWDTNNNTDIRIYNLSITFTRGPLNNIVIVNCKQAGSPNPMTKSLTRSIF